MAVYDTETAVRIVLETGIPLAGTVDHEIRYEDPAGTVGAWKAHVLAPRQPGDGRTKIYVNVQAPLQAGNWRLWSWVLFPDGREAVGQADRVRIAEEGRS